MGYIAEGRDDGGDRRDGHRGEGIYGNDRQGGAAFKKQSFA